MNTPPPEERNRLTHAWKKLVTKLFYIGRMAVMIQRFKVCLGSEVYNKQFGTPVSVVPAQKEIVNPQSRRVTFKGEEYVLGEQTAVSGKLKKDLERRTTAAKAFLDANNSRAVRSALLKRSRPQRTAYDVGDWVFYWRPEKSGHLTKSCWQGPALVVAVEGGGVGCGRGSAGAADSCSGGIGCD